RDDADGDAHRLARSGGDLLRRPDGGALPRRTRLDGGRDQRDQERGPEPHRAPHRATGLGDGHAPPLQPQPPALHGPLRVTRRRTDRDGDPLATTIRPDGAPVVALTGLPVSDFTRPLEDENKSDPVSLDTVWTTMTAAQGGRA